MWPIVFILPWMSEKLNSFLKWIKGQHMAWYSYQELSKQCINITANWLWFETSMDFKNQMQWPWRKFPKYSDTQNICCNHSKIWTMWLYHRVMGPNDADGMANSVDPDQTAPLGAVWSGSALFAQAYLSENLGSLRYYLFIKNWHICYKVWYRLGC